MDLHDTLLAFSEWLDGQGLIVPEDEGRDKTRTHDELATEFIEQWTGNPLPGAALKTEAVEGATEVPRG